MNCLQTICIKLGPDFSDGVEFPRQTVQHGPVSWQAVPDDTVLVMKDILHRFALAEGTKTYP